MIPREKAAAGLQLLKEAIIETLRDSSHGLRNAEIADRLELRSDCLGAQKDYLSWSVLGLLLNAGIIERQEDKRYVLPKQ